MGAGGGSALCERVCFVWRIENRQLCVGSGGEGLYLLSFSLKSVISKNDVLHLLQQGYLFHSTIITLLIY